MIENVTLLGRVADKSFDELWVAPSWKIIRDKLKYRKVVNAVAFCLNCSSLGSAGQD